VSSECLPHFPLFPFFLRTSYRGQSRCEAYEQAFSYLKTWVLFRGGGSQTNEELDDSTCT
jgi:hypothetical protein